jgi:hypothetical protein
MEALADHKAVGVRAVVVTHLGREPTRSKLEAARVVHVSVPSRLNQRGGTFLVAARSEFGLLDWPDESALQTVATQGPPLIDKTTEALNAIVAARHTAAATADDVQLDTVNDASADPVVQMMAVSLRKLNRLLGQLVGRRSVWTTTGASVRQPPRPTPATLLVRAVPQPERQSSARNRGFGGAVAGARWLRRVEKRSRTYLRYGCSRWTRCGSIDPATGDVPVRTRAMEDLVERMDRAAGCGGRADVRSLGAVVESTISISRSSPAHA